MSGPGKLADAGVVPANTVLKRRTPAALIDKGTYERWNPSGAMTLLTI